MTKGTRPVEEERASSLKPYKAPRLTLIGNLNDLLAGTGSKDTDNPPVCKANSTIADPNDCG